MFKKLKEWLNKPVYSGTRFGSSAEDEKPRPEHKPPCPDPMSEKDIATEKGEPWVNVLSMDVDIEDINEGSFELDWNDKFITTLIKHGYTGKTDADIVDQWFQNVCRNIVLETYEQHEANNPSRYHRKRNIGDGRSEIS
jgi:hypothetical protein